MITVAGMLGCIAFPIIVARPEYGAYIILLANPLIVGIARGQLGSILRPNEFLLAFVLIAICIRGVLLVHGHRRSFVAFDQFDTALLILVGAGSVAPVLWRNARGLTLSEDDLLYALVLLKYYALFRVFRSAISTTRQVEICLRLSVASASTTRRAMKLVTIGILLFEASSSAFSGLDFTKGSIPYQIILGRL